MRALHTIRRFCLYTNTFLILGALFSVQAVSINSHSYASVLDPAAWANVVENTGITTIVPSYGTSWNEAAAFRPTTHSVQKKLTYGYVSPSPILSAYLTTNVWHNFGGAGSAAYAEVWASKDNVSYTPLLVGAGSYYTNYSSHLPSTLLGDNTLFIQFRIRTAGNPTAFFQVDDNGTNNATPYSFTYTYHKVPDSISSAGSVMLGLLSLALARKVDRLTLRRTAG